MDFEKLKEKALKFRDERDWKQFHSPKNLAEGLTIEAAELMENFLWMAPEDTKNLDQKRLEMVRQELADVFLFTIYLSHELDIDLFEAAQDKIKLNAAKYPVDLVKGKSKKYTEYE